MEAEARPQRREVPRRERHNSWWLCMRAADSDDRVGRGRRRLDRVAWFERSVHYGAAAKTANGTLKSWHPEATAGAGSVPSRQFDGGGASVRQQLIGWRWMAGKNQPSFGRAGNNGA